MSKINQYILSWDNEHCEKHVTNLVDYISNKLINYYGMDSDICLIDIGANVGKVYDLLSKKINIVETHMFEANYSLYNYLIDKYTNNNIISIYHKAVSSNSGLSYFDESSMEYQIDNNCIDLNFGLSKITQTPTNRTVENIKLSDFFNNRHLYDKKCFIKIDTENCDYQILSDLISVINLFTKKPIIEFENNYFVDGYDSDWAQNIVDQYALKGYEKLVVSRDMGDGILQPIL